MSVDYIYKLNVELNHAEVTTLQVALDYRIEDYKALLESCAKVDVKSKAIFEDKLEMMRNLKLKLEEF